jgi:hypothetical protein
MQTPWIAHAYTARTPGTRPNAHAMPTSTSTCIAYACTCGGDQSAERLAADGARLAAPLQLLGAASAAAGVATTEDHSAGGVETDDAYFAGLRGGRSALLRRPLGRRPLRHFCRLHHSRPLCRRRPLRRRPLPLLRRRALRCRLRRRPLLLTLQSHMHVHVSVCWRWKG